MWFNLRVLMTFLEWRGKQIWISNFTSLILLTCTVELRYFTMCQPLSQNVGGYLRWEDDWEREIPFVLCHAEYTLGGKTKKNKWSCDMRYLGPTSYKKPGIVL